MASVDTLPTTGEGDSPAFDCPGIPVDRLSLAQAAARLGHSEKTLRRWIKNGRLPATLEPGPYGPQYWVSTQAVQAAQQVLEVVAVERAPDAESLALAVAQAIEQRDAALRADLERRENALRAELAAIQDKLDTLLARVDSVPTPCPPSPAQPAWWARLWPWAHRAERGASAI
jgi:MerR family transcriptional regulator, copper efflux regulator